MTNLWFAIVVYCAGLGAVLYIRPSLMFMENGAWKEFGYQRGPRYTIFPFWLFTIAWAIVSYAIAAATGIMWNSDVGMFSASAGAAASMGHSGYDWSAAEVDTDADADTDAEAEAEARADTIAEGPKRRGPGRPRKYPEGKPRPGYYVLEEKPAQSEQSGLRRYIYYGDAPPS
jgi:hypothetical protein